MKFKKFNMKVGTAFDPNKDFTADVAIILKKHPTKPNEGATKGYVDEKTKEFYENGIADNIITNTKVLPIKGPELNYSSDRTLTLKELPGNMEDKTGVIAAVDKEGRVIGLRNPTDKDIDYDKKIDFEDVTDIPDDLASWGITGLVSSKKHTKIKGKISVNKNPVSSTSILPFSYLNVIWEDSGYKMLVGDVVMKFGNPDRSLWLRANGSKVLKKDAPELVKYLTGSDTAQEAYLPDCTQRDKYVLDTFGLQASSYIRAKIHSNGIPIPMP